MSRISGIIDRPSDLVSPDPSSSIPRPKTNSTLNTTFASSVRRDQVSIQDPVFSRFQTERSNFTRTSRHIDPIISRYEASGVCIQPITDISPAADRYTDSARHASDRHPTRTYRYIHPIISRYDVSGVCIQPNNRYTYSDRHTPGRHSTFNPSSISSYSPTSDNRSASHSSRIQENQSNTVNILPTTIPRQGIQVSERPSTSIYQQGLSRTSLWEAKNKRRRKDYDEGKISSNPRSADWKVSSEDVGVGSRFLSSGVSSQTSAYQPHTSIDHRSSSNSTRNNRRAEIWTASRTARFGIGESGGPGDIEHCSDEDTSRSASRSEIWRERLTEPTPSANTGTTRTTSSESQNAHHQSNRPSSRSREYRRYKRPAPYHLRPASYPHRNHSPDLVDHNINNLSNSANTRNAINNTNTINYTSSHFLTRPGEIVHQSNLDIWRDQQRLGSDFESRSVDRDEPGSISRDTHANYSLARLIGHTPSAGSRSTHTSLHRNNSISNYNRSSALNADNSVDGGLSEYPLQRVQAHSAFDRTIPASAVIPALVVPRPLSANISRRVRGYIQTMTQRRAAANIPNDESPSTANARYRADRNTAGRRTRENLVAEREEQNIQVWVRDGNTGFRRIQNQENLVLETDTQNIHHLRIPASTLLSGTIRDIPMPRTYISRILVIGSTPETQARITQIMSSIRFRTIRTPILTTTQINEIESRVYSVGALTGLVQEIICGICHEDYVDGVDLRVLKCRHYFHKYCADRWLSANNSCPTCRGRAVDIAEQPVIGSEFMEIGRELLAIIERLLPDVESDFRDISGVGRVQDRLERLMTLRRYAQIFVRRILDRTLADFMQANLGRLDRIIADIEARSARTADEPRQTIDEPDPRIPATNQVEPREELSRENDVGAAENMMFIVAEERARQQRENQSLEN